MWIAACGPEEVEAALQACHEVPRRGEVTLVLGLPPDRDVALPALERAGGIADTLVVVATEADRLSWGALGAADVRAVAARGGRGRVLVEPDPVRAVAGAMQWLRPDDTFGVVWAREAPPAGLEALIGLGAAWRGAWDEAENGELHAGPRGPTGRCTFGPRATSSETNRGDDE